MISVIIGAVGSVLCVIAEVVAAVDASKNSK